MINELDEYEKFKLLRPLYSDHVFDSNGIPIIKKDDFNFEDLNDIYLCNFKNIKSFPDKKKTIVIMFNYDKIIDTIWNDPLKYLPKLLEFKAICSPDYSVNPKMNINCIRYNVFRNRWIGCFLQEKGVKVIPTIQWASEDTYDLCFSGVEKGSVVIVSTIGCLKNKDVFLNGFNEMKRRIAPVLIIVFGKMIDGMTGTFLHFNYEDCFMKKETYEQLRLFPVDNIFTISGGISYGQ